MSIIDFEFETWYTLCMRFNWVTLLVAIVIIAVIVYAIKKASKNLGSYTVYVDEVSLGIGNSCI